MENPISDIIQSVERFEWEGTSVGPNTLFYTEYKNFGVGNTSKRFTWKEDNHKSCRGRAFHFNILLLTSPDDSILLDSHIIWTCKFYDNT